jgi:hypothetical protein
MSQLQLLSCELPWLILAHERLVSWIELDRAGSLTKKSNEPSLSRATNERVERASELRVFRLGLGPTENVQHQDLVLQYLDKTLATYVRNN